MCFVNFETLSKPLSELLQQLLPPSLKSTRPCPDQQAPEQKTVLFPWNLFIFFCHTVKKNGLKYHLKKQNCQNPRKKKISKAMATSKTFLMKPVCFGEKRRNPVLNLAEFFLQAVPNPSLRRFLNLEFLLPEKKNLWFYDSKCNWKCQYLEITNYIYFKSHKNVSEDPFLSERKGKVCLLWVLFYFEKNIKEAGKWAERTKLGALKVCCFSNFSHFTILPGAQPSKRAFVLRQIQRSLTTTHSEFLRIRKPKKQMMTNIFTDHTSASFFLTHCN